MHRAVTAFTNTIRDARSLSALYDFLTTTVVSPFSYDDLLRSQIVYSVGAFDKLIHELIRIGMVASFMGLRRPTPKYHAESISIEFHGVLLAATLPPKEILFEQQIARKLRVQSFQDPIKVADGLSFIWDEKDKWVKIANAIGCAPDEAKTKLKLIVQRRNAIVHESDSDPLSVNKNPITRAECADVTDFLELCGNTIASLVIAN
jgi:hypothetical protein